MRTLLALSAGLLLLLGPFLAADEVVLLDGSHLVGTFDRFDSMPPVAAEKNDYGVSVGLGYSH